MPHNGSFSAVVYFGGHHGAYVRGVSWREVVEFLAGFGVVDDASITREAADGDRRQDG